MWYGVLNFFIWECRWQNGKYSVVNIYHLFFMISDRCLQSKENHFDRGWSKVYDKMILWRTVILISVPEKMCNIIEESKILCHAVGYYYELHRYYVKKFYWHIFNVSCKRWFFKKFSTVKIDVMKMWLRKRFEIASLS